MKKLTILAMLILATTGCASKPPEPPEPTGEFTPVNPDSIHISDLKL